MAIWWMMPRNGRVRGALFSKTQQAAPGAANKVVTTTIVARANAVRIELPPYAIIQEFPEANNGGTFGCCRRLELSPVSPEFQEAYW